ncbi:single-stranded DNA-binding protein [Actinobaculum sp. 352]|uniref:single-stranded DNA-binding protein n=1 Tax=Actinobaculum sp. 352 TaxID=2490946 RepID=UPI0013E07FFD|nr:single-stranded DNA-binding protein [Actinobaculum sp. 352]
MSNETLIAIRGYVGADPTVFSNALGRTTSLVRVGVTPRNFRRDTRTFENGTTSWYSVRCYGDLGTNVAECVRRGTPVLVRGRLNTRTWTDKEGHNHSENVIVADAFGIELSTGQAKFVKTRQKALDPVDGEPRESASNTEPLRAYLEEEGNTGTGGNGDSNELDGEQSALQQVSADFPAEEQSQSGPDPAGNLSAVMV